MVCLSNWTDGALEAPWLYLGVKETVSRNSGKSLESSPFLPPAHPSEEEGNSQ